MSALDHFLLVELLATPTGTAGIRMVGSGLRQGQAIELALARRRKGSIHFVASPKLRGAKVIIADDHGATGLVSEKALVLHLGRWLDWLRGHGALRLTTPDPDGTLCPLGPRWLADPLVSASLGIILSSAPAPAQIETSDISEWIEASNRHSVAGLLREAGLSNVLSSWLESVPAHSRFPLYVPLLEAKDKPDGYLYVGWLAHQHHDHAFSLGDASILQVNPSGWIEPSILIIDRDQPAWPRMMGAPLVPADPAFQFNADPQLDRLFTRLPAMAEHTLSVAAHEAVRAGADAEAVITCHQKLCYGLQQQLGPLTASMTERLLERTWPVRGAPATLKRSRYLHGGGVALLRERRQSLAALSPALATHIADGKCPMAAEAVDNGRPLVTALAEDWSVPVWAARRTVAMLRDVPSLNDKGIQAPDLLATYVSACGPHAPTLQVDDLRFLEELAQFVPGPAGGTNALAMLRAAGREASVHGWEGVCETIEHYDDVDGNVLLLAWWDTLRDNVADVLTQDNDGIAPHPNDIEAVFAAWMKDVPLSECFRMSLDWIAAFWGHEPSMFQKVDVFVPRLFAPLTLCESRVEVALLTSYPELREEGREMMHCVGSYHMAVMTGSVVVASMQCTTSGQRATVAVSPKPGGGWQLKEVSGVGNIRLPPESRIHSATEELLTLLGEPSKLDPLAIEFHAKHASSTPNLFDLTVGGRCLVRLLPQGVAEVALRCFPGAGPLQRRVLRAAGEVRGGARQSPRAAASSRSDQLG